MSTANQKTKARAELKLIRDCLSEKRKKDASIQACEDIYELAKVAKIILSFASFQSEINLWPLNLKLSQEKRLALPRLTAHGLVLFLVEDFKEMEPHPYGMLEPKNESRSLDLADIDIALIPGLGFDLNTKHRLGYGKGYYDRLLTNKLGTPQTWGIGYLEQEIRGLLFEETDVPLDRVLLF